MTLRWIPQLLIHLLMIFSFLWAFFKKGRSLLLCVNFHYHQQKSELLLNSTHMFFFLCLAPTRLSLMSFSHSLIMSVLMIVLSLWLILIVLLCHMTVIFFPLLKLQLHNFSSRLSVLALVGLSEKIQTFLYHAPVRSPKFLLEKTLHFPLRPIGHKKPLFKRRKLLSVNSMSSPLIML